jgi:DNA-binding protein H-NS
MAKPSLARMGVASLMRLRQQVDEKLQEHRAKLQRQLDRLGEATGGEGDRLGRQGKRVGAVKGRRVRPKYRSPAGETWAGRGARPRWLVAELKRGKKLDQFLIDKSARKLRKRRKAKRGRKRA